MNALVALLLFGSVMLSQEALAQSRLPPSNPGSAYDVGTIDYARATYFSPLKLFPCTRHQVVLKWDVPDINAAWIKFSVAVKGSRIFVKMAENPPQTVWFELYDQNFKLVEDAEKYRGAVNEEINRTFEVGTYYIKVLTRGDVAHLSDGTNTGNILFRGFPPNFDYPNAKAEPIVLPGLADGSPISYNATVLNIIARNMGSPAEPGKRDCLRGADGGFGRIWQRFIIPTAPAGKIRVTAGVRSQDNWFYNSGVFFATASGWQKVEGDVIDHGGGPLNIAVGASPLEIHVSLADGYRQFELQVAVAKAVGSPGGSGGVVVVPHQRKNMAVGATVPISSWLNVNGTWTQYRITQMGPVMASGAWEDGYLTLDGKKFLGQAPGSVVILPPNRHSGEAVISAEQLSKVIFHAGTVGIENLILLHGFDGTKWVPISAVVIKMIAN